MSTSAESIESEALSLPFDERARLVAHLLDSLDSRPRANPARNEQTWLQEADRRFQAYLKGEEEAIPADDVFSSLRDDDH
jgi:putative addiction module component (TIGR02574 family)